MTVHSVDALVEEVLSCVPDHKAHSLRNEAVKLAFDMKLSAGELADLLAALEQRTGTRLERRAGVRVKTVRARA